jgi:transposase
VVTMFIRVTTAKGHRYLQLVHNYRDPNTKITKTKVLHSFGREDVLDLKALGGLARAICKYLEPKEAQALEQRLTANSPFEFIGSLDLGGTWLLDQVWKRLQMDTALWPLLWDHGYAIPVERLLFALTANRALAPSSNLSMEDWVGGEVMIPGLKAVSAHELNRVMDFLLENHKEIERGVYLSVGNLLSLEVDVVFLDTMTTYLGTEGEAEVDELRQRRYSKDDFPGSAQAVIGFAVTRDGIPVRSWVWPGNTIDKSVIAQVKRDLNEWKLGRMLIVLDNGFNSPASRQALQGAGDHYIIGEKIRFGQQVEPAEALSRAGRYRKLDCGLEIKEVVVDGDNVAPQRFVVVHNPEAGERDRVKRADIVAEAEARLSELQQLQGEAYNEMACALRAHTACGCYIKQSKTGVLSINRARIRAEAVFDGKFLVRSSDEALSAEEVALGYKQLWQIERVHRELKYTVDVRPVYHRLEDRVRAHVLLCWLALLLIRVVENETGETWNKAKAVLAKLKVGIHRTQNGEVWQSTPLTAAQSELFRKLKAAAPTRYLDVPAVTPKVKQ